MSSLSCALYQTSLFSSSWRRLVAVALGRFTRQWICWPGRMWPWRWNQPSSPSKFSRWKWLSWRSCKVRQKALWTLKGWRSPCVLTIRNQSQKPSQRARAVVVTKALWARRTLHVKWLNSRWAQEVQQSFLVEGAVRGLLLRTDSHRRMETRNFQICLWGVENCSLQKCVVHWFPWEGKGGYWQVQFACSSGICL